MSNTPRTPDDTAGDSTHHHAGAQRYIVHNGTKVHIHDYDRAASRENELRHLFTYHAPTSDQIPRYQQLREKGLELALLINDLVPAGADQSAAIRLVREAIWTANAGIATERKGS